MRKHRGFTIIELLVVIVIIGLIVVIGAGRYREFSQRQVVVSAKRQIMADIRSAQSDAASGRKPADCTGTLTGYAFSVTPPSTYRVYAVCAGGNVTIKNGTAPAGITLSAPSVNPVIFYPVAQGNNLGATQEVTITINNSGVNQSSVVVRGSGEIR